MAYDPNNAAQKRLVEWVEFRVDSITPVGQTPAINHDSIWAELEEAAKAVLRKAPLAFVYPAAKDGTTAMNTAKTTVAGRLTLPLPDDFIRFLRLAVDGWSVPIDDLLDVRANQYRLQLNQFSRAQASAPLGVLVPYPAAASKRAVEAFPASADPAPVEAFYYVGTTSPELMPAELQDGMVWEATARVMLNSKEFNAAQSAMAGADRALSGLLVGQKGEEAAK